MQAPISRLAGEASGLLRFHTARAALIAYLASAEELRWRTGQLLYKTNQLFQAVARLLDAGVSHFARALTRVCVAPHQAACG